MLEVVVRPAQSPNIRPQAPLGLASTPETPTAVPVEWGAATNALFTHKTERGESVSIVANEDKRTYDTVRIKNKDDPEQYIDTEVMTKYESTNSANKQKLVLKFKSPEESDNIEVLSRNNER